MADVSFINFTEVNPYLNSNSAFFIKGEDVIVNSGVYIFCVIYNVKSDALTFSPFLNVLITNSFMYLSTSSGFTFISFVQLLFGPFLFNDFDIYSTFLNNSTHGDA